MNKCRVSIITPSMNMLPYLKRCHASVADQTGAEVEHIVVDGASQDGTVGWLSGQADLRFITEKDNGMYDAINKGLRIAAGDIVAYLNCDEQYLADILAYVVDYFDANRDIDILFGGALTIRPDGQLISFRKAYPCRWFYIVADHTYLLSCATFWRKKIFLDGHHFDPSFKSAGDAEFLVQIMRSGYRAAHVKRYLAAFTMTGENLSMVPNDHEVKRLLSMYNPLLAKVRWPLIVMRRVEKLLNGAYFRNGIIKYAIYTDDKPDIRKEFVDNSASFRWKQG